MTQYARGFGQTSSHELKYVPDIKMVEKIFVRYDKNLNSLYSIRMHAGLYLTSQICFIRIMRIKALCRMYNFCGSESMYV